jgi:uncharacterized membrane protein
LAFKHNLTVTRSLLFVVVVVVVVVVFMPAEELRLGFSV